MSAVHRLLLAAALGAAPLSAAAQPSEPIPPGRQVRVWLVPRSEPPFTASVLSTSRDSLLLRTRPGTGDSLLLGWREVRRLDWLDGRRSHWQSGAGIGLVVGALVGYAIGNKTGQSDPSFSEIHEFVGLVAGAGGGLATGAVVGAFIKTDRWRRVPLAPHPGGEVAAWPSRALVVGWTIRI
jgi:hypothetical protein